MRCFCNALADKKQEGATGTLELKEKQSDSGSHSDDDDCDEPEIVKLMMQYFYHFDYLESAIATSNDLHGDNCWDEFSWTSTPATKSSKKSKSKRASQQDSTKVHLIEHAKLFAMAVKYQIVALQRLTIQKFEAEARQHWNHEDLPRATIHLIYTTTPDEVTELREVAVGILHTYYDYFVGRPDVQSLLRSINGLACDLLNRDHQKEKFICFNRQAHGIHKESADASCSECGKVIKVCNECAWEPNIFLCETCTSTQRTWISW